MTANVLYRHNTSQKQQTDAASIRADDAEYVMPTYRKQQAVFVRGAGCRLWDSEGNEYLDFLGGIAVALVGHSHPAVARAIAEQARTLMHVSNLFHHPLQAALARKLCALTGMEKAFFCNSGAEANEAAIKIARKWGKGHRSCEKFEIITFEGSFHGRTLGTLAATAQPKYQAPFTPLVPGFQHAAWNDIHSVEGKVSEKTCAILVEPIQGESGVRPASTEFMKALRAICDTREILFIVDEIQCGMGRTGRFLASHAANVRADIVTLAKGIANGVPMGVCLARGAAATTLLPGDHGSTFGGQLIACAAALATLGVLEDEDLIANATRTGGSFLQDLLALKQSMPGRIAEVRGAGLMVGLEFTEPEAVRIGQLLFNRGIIVNVVGERILRFLPPLTVTSEDCKVVVETLSQLIQEGANA